MSWAERAIWPLVSAATMRRLDRYTIENLGIPGALLMECAGTAVVAEVAEALRPGAAVWIVCGPGNNGGDGLVAARHLHLQGVPVRLVCTSDPAQLRGDAAANRDRAVALGLCLEQIPLQPAPGDCVVDAIFGTGLARPVDGEAAVRLREIQAFRARDPQGWVIAVDLPSGLAADTGQVLGSAVQADATLTLGLPKLGLTLEPGRSLAGRIRVARIGIVDEAPEASPEARLYTAAAIGARLPSRPAAGHKGRFGHVLVAAGSAGKTGAAALAAEGAARVGAGLVTVACPAGTQAILAARCIEAMTEALPELASHAALGLAAEKPLLELAAARDVLLLGPGLGRADETRELVRRVARAAEQPLVLDADALIAVAEDLTVLHARAAPAVLTPHPGEAAVLLGSDVAAVNADRIGAARELARRSGAVAVLKGRATVIAAADGRVAVNSTGGPNLATGGTGDVLAGVVAGLLGQGVEAFEAGVVASFVHGRAGDRLAARFGPSGALAGEVARALPEAIQELRQAAEAAGVPGVGNALSFPEPG